MSLQPIPHEDTEINFCIKPLKGARKIIKPFLTKVVFLKKKLAGHLKHLDDVFLHKTTLQMFSFVKNGRGYSYKQLNDLIQALERSILCLQRKKKILIWRQMTKDKERKGK